MFLLLLLLVLLLLLLIFIILLLFFFKLILFIMKWRHAAPRFLAESGNRFNNNYFFILHILINFKIVLFNKIKKLIYNIL